MSYVHKYQNMKDEWITSIGYWGILHEKNQKDQWVISLWDWRPYPNDTVVSITPNCPQCHYPIINADIHYDRENKLIIIDSFKGNSQMKFIRDLREGTYKE
ncbi:MAG: hypothetical protein ACHQM6_08045 [Candidatus Kapaibacterium sp.]